jgi:hypothetical protein
MVRAPEKLQLLGCSHSIMVFNWSQFRDLAKE